MRENDIEMICPECGSEMKEYIQSFKCRNLNCRWIYKKYFQIDPKSCSIHPVIQRQKEIEKTIEDIKSIVKICEVNTAQIWNCEKIREAINKLDELKNKLLPIE